MCKTMFAENYIFSLFPQMCKMFTENILDKIDKYDINVQT